MKLYNPSFFNALIQALPLSKPTALSPEVPPKTTKTFLNFFYSPIILISSSNFSPVFSSTFF